MGIRIKEAPSGKEIVGTVDGQILVWNNATQRWDVGSAVGGSAMALEDFGSTIVPPNTTTASADGTVHTALATIGAAAFPAGSKLEVEFMSTLSGDGAGKVEATLELEVSLDGGATWNPVSDDAVGWFDSVALNDPVSSIVQRDSIDLSGAPSFALRFQRINGATAVAGASFSNHKVFWAYNAP